MSRRHHLGKDQASPGGVFRPAPSKVDAIGRWLATDHDDDTGEQLTAEAIAHLGDLDVERPVVTRSTATPPRLSSCGVQMAADGCPHCDVARICATGCLVRLTWASIACPPPQLRGPRGP